MALGYKNKTWVNNSPPQETSEDLNLWKNESINLISSSGQTPDNAIADQQAKAVAQYAATGDFYTDSGVADAYALNPIGSGPQNTPISYIDGMRIRFVPGNDNTGASTINVNSLGVKDIKSIDGTTDPIPAIIKSGVGIEMFYDSGNDAFIISSFITGIIRLSVEMGDWNMDTTSLIQVTHNLDPAKFRSISAIIRNDASTFSYDISGDASDSNIDGYKRVGATALFAERVSGGFFDATSFNDTPFNRGFWTFDYEI